MNKQSRPDTKVKQHHTLVEFKAGYNNGSCCPFYRACSVVVIVLRSALVPKVLGSNLAFSTKLVTCLFMLVE
jgi:hypothetical protein